MINSYYYYYYNIFFVKKHHYMVEKLYCFWYYHVLSTFVTVAILYVFNVCLSKKKHSETNCVFEWTKLTRKVLVNMAHLQLNGSLLKLVSKYICIYIYNIYILYIHINIIDIFDIYICTCIFKNVSCFCFSGEKKRFFWRGFWVIPFFLISSAFWICCFLTF